MSQQEKKPYQNVKIPCRISFAYLAEKGTNQSTGEPDKYRVQCLIPKTDENTVLAIRKAMKAVWIDTFGEDSSKWHASRTNFRAPDFFKNHLSEKGQDGFPLRDGDKQYGKEDMYGLVFLQAADAKNRPMCGVVLNEKQFRKLETKEEIEHELYSGCYANVHVDFFCIKPNEKNGNNAGIGVSLKAVVKTADGERLSGSSPIDLSAEYGEEVVGNVGSYDDL